MHARCRLCRYAAAFKPVTLVKGANHAQMNTGEISAIGRERGDLQPDTSHAEACSGMASIITRFLAAHMAPEE